MSVVKLSQAAKLMRSEHELRSSTNPTRELSPGRLSRSWPKR
jgi:hypothetical protein